LLLQDGHCFRDGILNLCKIKNKMRITIFRSKSGSFETLIKLADEGLGTTLLPIPTYFGFKRIDKLKLRHL
jgi:LysR family hydrogen peroxide-inducible transcriptional activator